MDSRVSLEGRLGQIIYHGTNRFSDSGCKFLIAELHTDDWSRTKIKGEMNTPVYGWRYRFFGKFIHDEQRDEEVFRFNTFDPIIPSSGDGIVDYLARHVDGLGSRRARQIVNQFGNETIRVLRESPDRIREIRGIGDSVTESVINFFSSPDAKAVDVSAYARLVDLLAPIHPPRKVITALAIHFGSNAPQYITENPYRLLDYPGMGWKTVDHFAIHILDYDRQSIHRHKSAVIEVLHYFVAHGHTRIDIASVREQVSRMAGDVLDNNAIDQLVDEFKIYRDPWNFLSFSHLLYAEQTIAYQLRRIADNATPFHYALDREGLEGEQIDAIEVIQDHGVSVLSGCAGSGKSYTISKVIASIHRHAPDAEILVVCPTGKAAKRNDELLSKLLPGVKITCSTIHRALGTKFSAGEEGVPQEDAKVNRGRNKFEFLHTKDNPLHADFVVVDECSMLDVQLGAALYQAIPDSARLLLVGDHHQLPSVGPGSCLRDLIDAGVATAILSTPRRNSGLIAYSCYAIKQGLYPKPAPVWDLPKGRNWVHKETKNENESMNEIARIIQEHYNKYGPSSTKWDIQVISPEKKGILGCNNINVVLRDIINPQTTSTNTEYRIGDKVIRTLNKEEQILLPYDITKTQLVDIFGDEHVELMEKINWRKTSETIIVDEREYFLQKCGLVNGDMGEVLSLYEGDGPPQIIVQFNNPMRIFMLPLNDPKLLLAYAVTAHKFQGSGARFVICPLTDFYWNQISQTGIFSRELLYTMFSRAIEQLLTVGSIKYLYRAIDRKTVGFRKTRLRHMIRQLA